MSDFVYILETYSHYGMSDFYVHIRNAFTLQKEWILCTYKKHTHITEWVILCTYKKRIHIREWVTFVDI